MGLIKSLTFFVLIAGAFAIPGESRDWPCPLSDAIYPCTCTSSEQFEMDLDCSPVVDDETLANVFQQVFPFSTFRKFTLIHDNNTIGDSLSTLNPSTFGTISFQEFHIQGTNIATIEQGTFFMSNNSMITLTLPDNSLSTFPFNDIFNFSILQTLNLHGNALTNVPQIISTSLQHITLSQNWALLLNGDEFVTCPQITTLDLREDGLTSLPSGLVNNSTFISELQFSGNKIDNIPTGGISPPSNSITLLSLNENGLTSLEPGAIVGIAVNAFLEFSNNLIIDIPQQSWEPMFAFLGSPNSVNLAGNPLTCGCDMAWLVLNSENKAKLTDGTTCADGTFVKDLPSAPFMNC